MRLNISVPDDLHDRLGRWRRQLNFSAICQEALEAAVARKEARSTSSLEDQEVISRLRREKEDLARGWFDIGVQLGLQWARRAPYLELKAEIHRLQRLKKGPSSPSTLRDPIDLIVEEELGEYDPEVLFMAEGAYPDREMLFERYPALRNALDFTKIHGLGWQWFAGESEGLREGWLEGIESFWQSVKDLI